MTVFRFDVVGEYWPLFQEGAGMTIKLTLACVFCGVILGMLLGLAIGSCIPRGRKDADE